MVVRPYYGTIPERASLRQNLLQEAAWDVLVTTYNFAQGGDYDRKFFKKTPWAVRRPSISMSTMYSRLYRPAYLMKGTSSRTSKVSVTATL
jgi:hypothetical protein